MFTYCNVSVLKYVLLYDEVWCRDVKLHTFFTLSEWQKETLARVGRDSDPLWTLHGIENLLCQQGIERVRISTDLTELSRLLTSS